MEGTMLEQKRTKQKVIEMSINWLDDPDYVPMNKKAWNYFNN